MVVQHAMIISWTSTDVLPLNAGTSCNTPTKLSHVGCFLARALCCFGILMRMYSSVSVTSTSLWVSNVFICCFYSINTKNIIPTHPVKPAVAVMAAPELDGFELFVAPAFPVETCAPAVEAALALLADEA